MSIPLFRHIVKFYFVQLMIIDFHNIYLGAILRILTNALSSFKSPRKQILKTLPSIINQIQLFILAKSYVWKTPIVLILQSIYRNPKLIGFRVSHCKIQLEQIYLLNWSMYLFYVSFFVSRYGISNKYLPHEFHARDK